MDPLVLVVLSMKSAIMLFSASLMLKLFGIRNQSTVLIALFLALYGVINIDEVLHEAGFYQLYPQLLGLVFPLEFFLCPLFYWYLLASENNDRILTSWLSFKRHAFAFCAPIIAMLIAIPFYLLPAEDKLQILAGNAIDSEHYQLALLGCKTGFAMFSIVSVVYLVASYKRLFWSSDKVSVSYYAKAALLVITLGWSLSFVAEFAANQGLLSSDFRNGYHVFELTWLTLLASLLLLAASSSRVSSSLLSANQHKQMALLLDQTMQSEQLFLDPELTLSSLAKGTGMRPQIISETLNSHLRQNFFEFVNGYRINYACSALIESNKPISTIAIDAGFNSRTTFYTAFRRLKGSTPSQYRQQHKNNDEVCPNGAI